MIVARHPNSRVARDRARSGAALGWSQRALHLHVLRFRFRSGLNDEGLFG